MKRFLSIILLLGLAVTVHAWQPIGLRSDFYDIKCDANGQVHIIWANENEHFHYGKIINGRLSGDEIIPDSWNMEYKYKRPRLSVSPDGTKAAVAWVPRQPARTVECAFRDAAGWHHETAYNAPNGWFTSFAAVAVDNSGRVHVTAQQWNNDDSGNQPIIYAVRDGAGWHSSSLSKNRVYNLATSMFVDREGGIHAQWDAETKVGVSSHGEYCYAAPGTELQPGNIEILPDPVNAFKHDSGDLFVDKFGTVHLAKTCYRGRNETSINYWYKPKNGIWFQAKEIYPRYYVVDHGYQPWACMGVNDDGTKRVLWADEGQSGGKPAVQVSMTYYDPRNGGWQPKPEDNPLSTTAAVNANAWVSVAADSDYIYIVWQESTGEVVMEKYRAGLNGSVSFANPLNGARVSGLVPLTLSLSGADAGSISKVEFFANNQLIANDTTAPFETGWDTTMLPAGAYTLTARVYVVGGSSLDVTISVTKGSNVGAVRNLGAIAGLAKGYVRRVTFTKLMWEAPLGGNVASYKIYNTTSLTPTLMGTATTAGNYVLRNLNPGTYSITVLAVDGSGAVSDPVSTTVVIH